MKIKDVIVNEVATGMGTSSVSTVVNPTVAKSKRKPKKQKPTDNALDMKGVSLFGGSLLKR